MSNKPDQEINSASVKGSLRQGTKVAGARQSISDVEVGQDLEQMNNSDSQGLNIFGGNATGRFAVLCLTLIILGWLFFQFIIN